jgi:hypothetical protein
MAMKLRLGGAWRDITAARIFLGGAWRPLIAVREYYDGAWRDVANFTSGGGTITLTLSPALVTDSGRNSTVTTSNVTATPAGGQTPYTYAWAKQSGDDISAISPASAITAFRAINMSDDETRNAVFRCTCTDNLGSSDTADISISLTRLPPAEGPENPDL